jgi:peroxiredoxin
LHGILPELQQLGASLIAISPEKPDNSLTMIEKLELTFPVLTDVHGQVMKDYKVAWSLPEDLKEKYIRLLNRDFGLVNQGAGWMLPIPATFIIDQQGKVKSCYVNADYTKRMEPAQIIETIKSF